jgi:toxin-antitoxin system PIN domain toxin
MIAVDTNLLVYAHRSDAPAHASAQAALSRLARDPGGWAIPWPCAHEFLAVVTGRAFGEWRTPLDLALETLHAWLAHPGCRPIGETARHAEILGALASRAGSTGGAIHDARIAAICIEHAVEEFWTADRDFNRYPDLRTRNPLIPTLHEPAPARR